jgi:hypothetical protein
MEQIENMRNWMATMLDKVRKATPRRNAFEDWRPALPKELRETNHVAFAKLCFRAVYLLGARPTKTKFRFRPGRFVSAWATSSKEAAREVMIELNFRVAKTGRARPKTGWKLVPVHDDA